MPKKLERRALVPVQAPPMESPVASAIGRLNATEPTSAIEKLSVSLPRELRRSVKRHAFDADCSETSVVEIALRRLFELPDVDEILASHGSRYRRMT